MEQATTKLEGTPGKYWEHVPACDKCDSNTAASLFEAGTESLMWLSKSDKATDKSLYKRVYLQVTEYEDERGKLTKPDDQTKYDTARANFKLLQEVKISGR